MKIRKSAGNVLTNLDKTNDSVSTLNNIFDSLWNRVDVNINDKSINDPTYSWYAYEAYFENHLRYSKGTNSNLSYRGYFNDTIEQFDWLIHTTCQIYLLRYFSLEDSTNPNTRNK